MEIASVFLKSADLLLKITSSPIAMEIKSIRKYESEIKRFSDTVAMIGDVLSDVEDKQFQEKSVKRGYKRLREAYLDAEDFLDAVEAQKKKREAVSSKFNKEKEEMINKANGKRKQLLARARIKKKAILIKTHRLLSGPNQVKRVVKMHKAIKKIRKNLDEIEKDMKMFELIKEPMITLAATDHEKYRATGPCVDAFKVIGREEDKRKIVDLLIRSSADPKKIPVISIVGMGGLGKTTTAQLLYDDESWQQSCRFDLKLWVPDSKQFDVKSLLKSILKSISRRDTSVDNLEENHLRERLVEGIGGKSFFLVLDDVENEDILIWESLESLLNHGNKGESRILVTTRSRKVADVMGSDSPYELQGLSETDALQLFERYSFRGGRNEDLVEIGRLCVKKCLGVPLAIRVIRSLLCDTKDKHKWERVRKDIDSAIKDESNHIVPILMISYYNLDSTLKLCFSYCALFPKNEYISKQILSSIWRANVRLQNESGLLEDDCEKNMKTLCDRCLIEEAKQLNKFEDRYFKMHDLMHDLANNVAAEEMFVVNSNNLILKENVRHVNLMWSAIKDGEYSSFEVQGRRLRTFLQFGNPSCTQRRMELSVDELVLDCPVLRLLDIHSWGIKNLTNSIGKLIHLRYLDLSCNKFQTLPNSIVELINLRHLSLAECNALTHLPSGMDALTSLEVLDISRCMRLKELPMGIEKLINLRLLKLAYCWCLTHLPAGIEKLINLKHLKLEGCKSLTHMPSKMEALTSLEELDISYCDKLKELPMGIVKLINLKYSRFEGCRALTQLPTGTGALKSLCTLDKFKVGDPESNNSAQFEELGHLSESIRGKLEIELPNNITLKESLDGEAFLLNKKSLRELEIKWQDNPKEEVPSNHIDILAKLQPPTNLEVFRIDGYQGMTFPPWFPNECFASVLPNLTRLYISNCAKCQYLPPFSGLRCLKHLELRGLSNLEYIEENVSAALFCPSLEQLKLHDLLELKGWGRGPSTGADDNGERKQSLMLPSFPCLSRLEIHSCPNLTVAPILFSFVKVFSVNLNMKRQEIESSSIPPALSTSSVNLFVQVCRNSGGFYLNCSGQLLDLGISDWDASGSQSVNMVEPFREMSKHLRMLEISNCSGLKTLRGLQHLTALRHLNIKKCCDFTGEKDGQVTWKDLQCLEVLNFIDLPKMERLPEGIQFLTSLAILVCENCCDFTGAIDGQVSWKDLQSLTILRWIRLPKMERLPEGIQFLTTLSNLYIKHCDNLLLPEWLHKTFKSQTIRGVYLFERVIDRNI